eukprot:3907048-Amphidinium_carterae.1
MACARLLRASPGSVWVALRTSDPSLCDCATVRCSCAGLCQCTHTQQLTWHFPTQNFQTSF